MEEGLQQAVPRNCAAGSRSSVRKVGVTVACNAALAATGSASGTHPSKVTPCYPAQSFCNAAFNAMIETNPIFAHIADLRGRLDALRRYL